MAIRPQQNQLCQTVEEWVSSLRFRLLSWIGWADMEAQRRLSGSQSMWCAAVTLKEVSVSTPADCSEAGLLCSRRPFLLSYLYGHL